MVQINYQQEEQTMPNKQYFYHILNAQGDCLYLIIDNQRKQYELTYVFYNDKHKTAENATFSKIQEEHERARSVYYVKVF